MLGTGMRRCSISSMSLVGASWSSIHVETKKVSDVGKHNSELVYVYAGHRDEALLNL